MLHQMAPRATRKSRFGPRAPWVAAAVLSLAIGLVATGSPPAVSAATPCLEPPVTVADLIALEEEMGPLTLEFDPTYGAYAEHALLCFSDLPIELDAFLASPEGLGGVVAFTMAPAWMTSLAWFVADDDTITDEGYAAGPFMPVAVPPELEGGFTEARGRWVRLRGQFDDPVAQTCQVVSESPEIGAVPTPEEAIEICRTSFVVDTLTVLPGPPGSPGHPGPPTAAPPPPTDTVSAPVSATGTGADGGSATRLVLLIGSGVLGAAIGGLRGGRRRMLAGVASAGLEHHQSEHGRQTGTTDEHQDLGAP